MADRRNQHTRTELLTRVRGEFGDMPGLRLTHAQASKLLAHRADVCERILQELEREGMLKRSEDGAYCRSDLGG